MKKTLIALFLTLTVLGCTFTENNSLFKEMERQFNSGKKDIPLAEFTNFAWEDLCIFKASGPYASIAYNSYLDHATKKNFKDTIPSGDHGLIFVFSNKDEPVQQYFQKNAFLTVKGNEVPINVASDKKFVKFCVRAPGLTLTYDDTQAPPAIILSRQGP